MNLEPGVLEMLQEQEFFSETSSDISEELFRDVDVLSANSEELDLIDAGEDEGVEFSY